MPYYATEYEPNRMVSDTLHVFKTERERDLWVKSRPDVVVIKKNRRAINKSGAKDMKGDSTVEVVDHTTDLQGDVIMKARPIV